MWEMKWSYDRTIWLQRQYAYIGNKIDCFWCRTLKESMDVHSEPIVSLSEVDWWQFNCNLFSFPFIALVLSLTFIFQVLRLFKICLLSYLTWGHVGKWWTEGGRGAGETTSSKAEKLPHRDVILDRGPSPELLLALSSLVHHGGTLSRALSLHQKPDRVEMSVGDNEQESCAWHQAGKRQSKGTDMVYTCQWAPSKDTPRKGPRAECMTDRAPEGKSCPPPPRDVYWSWPAAGRAGKWRCPAQPPSPKELQQRQGSDPQAAPRGQPSETSAWYVGPRVPDWTLLRPTGWGLAS